MHSYFGVQNMTNSLAEYYTLKGHTNLNTDELNIYRSITREDIKRVANEYLNKNSRVEMDYLKKEIE